VRSAGLGVDVQPHAQALVETTRCREDLPAPLKVATRVRIPLGVRQNRRSEALPGGPHRFRASLPIPCQSRALVQWRLARKRYMRERSGGWELRVYAGRDPVSGRKRYLTRRVRGGKREAQRVLAALVVEATELGAPQQGTVTELMDEWLGHAERASVPRPRWRHVGSSTVPWPRTGTRTTGR
jgi:hypothetical protein